VELPPDPLDQQAEVQRSIAVAAAYFEDKLQVRPHRLLYSGTLPAREFAVMMDDAELAVGEVVPKPATGIASAFGHQSLAAVTGVLVETN
jgi:type IV pilus assembly protein PilM